MTANTIKAVASRSGLTPAIAGALVRSHKIPTIKIGSSKVLTDEGLRVFEGIVQDLGHTLKPAPAQSA